MLHIADIFLWYHQINLSYLYVTSYKKVKILCKEIMVVQLTQRIWLNLEIFEFEACFIQKFFSIFIKSYERLFYVVI